MEFLRFYINNLWKNFWILFISLPYLVPQAVKLLRDWGVAEFYPAKVESVFNDNKKYLIWLMPISFIFANVKISFDLWKKNMDLSTDSVATGLNDDYDALADWVRIISPTKYDSFMKKLKLAYKQYTKQSSVNRIISTHFSVYSLINKIIKDCYRERFIQRSTSTTQLTDGFIDKYNEFDRLNSEIGKSNPISIDLNDINKLIHDTNNNLGSIFSYHQP